MHQLQKKQLGPWCSFCPPKTNKALYVQDGWYGKFCCEVHKQEMLDYEKIGDDLTEADYQTWVNL
jgi:hypothetical protein